MEVLGNGYKRDREDRSVKKKSMFAMMKGILLTVHSTCRIINSIACVNISD